MYKVFSRSQYREYIGEEIRDIHDFYTIGAEENGDKERLGKPTIGQYERDDDD